MPVGRQHGLLGTWPPPGSGLHWAKKAINERQVAMMNTFLVARAYRFVASPTEDFTWMRGDGTPAGRAAFIEHYKRLHPEK